MLRGRDVVGNGKMYAAGGTKGYRWLEAEVVKQLGKQDDIDRTYYDHMAEAAIKDISVYGDFNWFVSDKPYDKEDNEILPF